jgi:predicted DCC family thiol-disulfide oxidoreductase YuxK
MDISNQIDSYLAEIPKDKKIILFDGVCNLCNSAVLFIIKNDKKDLFRFVALQSAVGEKIIAHIGVDLQKMDSIILYEPGIAYYYKSEAALKIASQLGSFFSLLVVFKILPTAFSDTTYDWIARNRYKWFGKKENCMIPTPELKSKFLE